MKRSLLELQFEQQLIDAGLTDFKVEVVFHHTRKWRFDFVFPKEKLAIEVEGGVWNSGRHTQGKGFTDDCIKYAEATLLGYTVLRVTGSMINSPDLLALNYTLKLLNRECHSVSISV